MFDILREYFFDYNAYTGNTSYKEIINSKLLKIYESKKDTNTSFSFDDLPSQFKNKYLEVTSNDVCQYAEELFKKNNNNNNTNYYSYIEEQNYLCHNLTENTTEYGLNLLISYYLEELRTQKNYFDKMLYTVNETKYK